VKSARMRVLSCLHSFVTRRATLQRRTALTIVRHSDPIVPPLDLQLVASFDEDHLTDEEDSARAVPPLVRQHASHDVFGERARGFRARRNAITHMSVNIPGLPMERAAGAPMERATSTSTFSEELSNVLPNRTLSARSAAALVDRICAICCEDMQADQLVACMPCEGLHAYHDVCIQQWLGRGKPQCPTCRWKVDEDSLQSLRSSVARATAHLNELQQPCKNTVGL